MLNIPQSMGVLPDWPNLTEAMDEVRRAGQRTGLEHIMILDRHGSVVGQNRGDERQVGFPEHLRGFHMCPEMFVVHCHPGIATPLSCQDILSAAGTGAFGQVAVTMGGGYDMATGISKNMVKEAFPNMPISLKHALQMIGMDDAIQIDTRYEAWVDILNAGFNLFLKAGFSEPDAHIAVGFLSSNGMHQMGFYKDHSYKLEDHALEVILRAASYCQEEQIRKQLFNFQP